jgi:hypothetical protein
MLIISLIKGNMYESFLIAALSLLKSTQILGLEPVVTHGVLVAIKVRYSEPIFNQQSGNIVKNNIKGLEQRNS